MAAVEVVLKKHCTVLRFTAEEILDEHADELAICVSRIRSDPKSVVIDLAIVRVLHPNCSRVLQALGKRLMQRHCICLAVNADLDIRKELETRGDTLKFLSRAEMDVIKAFLQAG